MSWGPGVQILPRALGQLLSHATPKKLSGREINFLLPGSGAGGPGGQSNRLYASPADPARGPEDPGAQGLDTLLSQAHRCLGLFPWKPSSKVPLSGSQSPGLQMLPPPTRKSRWEAPCSLRSRRPGPPAPLPADAASRLTHLRSLPRTPTERDPALEVDQV